MVAQYTYNDFCSILLAEDLLLLWDLILTQCSLNWQQQVCCDRSCREGFGIIKFWSLIMSWGGSHSFLWLLCTRGHIVLPNENSSFFASWYLFLPRCSESFTNPALSTPQPTRQKGQNVSQGPGPAAAPSMQIGFPFTLCPQTSFYPSPSLSCLSSPHRGKKDCMSSAGN